MELIHSAFQASFNARIERLADQEANELRTIFRYFDTDGDGAVAADQVLRIFGLLGLDINPAYVRDLEEVYLAEFLKIIDSNVPVVAVPSPEPAIAANKSAPPLLPTSNAAPASGTPTPVAHQSSEPDFEAIDRANALMWEDEWRALDSHRRGVVHRDELRLFLKSCFSPFPPNDLDRFLELYADPSLPEDSAALTKAAFLKFRLDYTLRERVQSEHGGSSDEDDNGGDDGAVDLALVEQALRGDNPEAPLAETTEPKRHRATHTNSISQVQPSGEADADGLIVIDPGVVEDDFVDDDDAIPDHDDGDHGDRGNQALYDEGDDGGGTSEDEPGEE